MVHEPRKLDWTVALPLTAGALQVNRRVNQLLASYAAKLEGRRSMQTGYPPIRRVVTGHDAAHVAKVLLDGPATNAKYPQPGQVSSLMWCTDSAPATIPIGEKPEDMGARILGTAPPRNGTRFTVIDFPPGNQPHMHSAAPTMPGQTEATNAPVLRSCLWMQSRWASETRSSARRARDNSE